MQRVRYLRGTQTGSKFAEKLVTIRNSLRPFGFYLSNVLISDLISEQSIKVPVRKADVGRGYTIRSSFNSIKIYINKRKGAKNANITIR